MRNGQFPLPIKPNMLDVDMQSVIAQPSMTSALILCQTLSGIEDKQLSGEGGVVKQPEQWSRIKGGSANFPHDKLIEYMDLCRNEVPLIWLALRRGYELTPLESEMQRRLRLSEEARVQAEERLAYAESLLKGR